MGAQGCVSVTANAFCKEVKRVYTLTQKQEIKQAYASQQSLQKINKLLFAETNPIPIKSLLSDMGYITDEVKMPLIKSSQKLKNKLSSASKKLLKKYNPDRT
jgi:4-hydroxy-tetrahydrodipicolinate synthase